jgi:cell division protein FtsL
VKGRIVIMYIFILTIPLFLGALAWQSARYGALEKEIIRNGERQEECIARNRRLIAEIALLSSSERIESLARNSLGLGKKRPEEVLQIRITGDL